MVLLLGAACSPSGNQGEPDVGAESTTQPPTTIAKPIAELMERTSMTSQARELFLKARPKIEGRAEFAGKCRNASGSHTLGCFLVFRSCPSGGSPSACSKETQIHLLQIQRPDASDLIYVSAAHEVLHAVYEEMPTPERRHIDSQLEAALPQLDQCRVDANLKAYAGRASTERLNELHSILATEFANLPPGLNAHYSRYFVNRQLVTQAHDRSLGGLEQDICRLQSRLDQLEARIGSLRRQLQQLRSAGNVRAYNSQVPNFNAMVTEHNQAVDSHNRRVREYNQLLVSLGGDAGVLQPRDRAEVPAQ
ncbi:MAG: hypothetical protein M3396_02730 [Actinomycetota bacterium]|nr:hypothetical protein [Actinomycetota bacterium]